MILKKDAQCNLLQELKKIRQSAIAGFLSRSESTLTHGIANHTNQFPIGSIAA